jgi:hypothetical protein
MHDQEFYDGKCVVLTSKRENVKHISVVVNNQPPTTNNLQVSKPLVTDDILFYKACDDC